MNACTRNLFDGGTSQGSSRGGTSIVRRCSFPAWDSRRSRGTQACSDSRPNECFNDWGGAGIREFCPRGSHQKQPLPGIGLHDPLCCWQANPELKSCQQRVGQISPRKGLFSCRPPPKRGQICDIPTAPLIVERLKRRWIRSTHHNPHLYPFSPLHGDLDPTSLPSLKQIQKAYSLQKQRLKEVTTPM